VGWVPGDGTWVPVACLGDGSFLFSLISLKPQGPFITSGPYRFSRNPLYLGGNVFIFFGAALFLGSSTALVATALHLPLMDRFIRREEEKLGRRFGEEWRSYRGRVRWI